jgi:Uma2 family endonuclease
MGDLGFFKNRRVQLVDGEIVEMSPAKPPHATSVELLEIELHSAFGRRFRIRIQLPIDLGEPSQPEPDACVLRGSPRDSAQHPATAELVVEVSDATLQYDRNTKARVYARAGIPEYWIVNLVDRQLEVHRNPIVNPSQPRKSRYADVTVVPADGQISPLVAPDVAFAVADFLP